VAQLVAKLAHTPTVVADIDHRPGCPENRGMESHIEICPDGIPVKVGRCAACGATAYRHGDVAVTQDRMQEEEE